MNSLNFQQEISQKHNESLWNIHWTMRIGFTHQIGCWGSAHNMHTKSAYFVSISNFQNFRFMQICGEISLWQSWQFQRIFCRLSYDVLLFFSRCCFHEEIWETKWAVLQFLWRKFKKPLSSGKFLPLKSFPEFFFWAYNPLLSERNILHSKILIRDPRW